MVRIDEYTNLFLFQLYEGGGYEVSIIFERLEINKSYDRNKAREVITQYISLNTKEQFDPNTGKLIHPILTLLPIQTRQLIDILQQDSFGKKINQFPEPPCIF